MDNIVFAVLHLQQASCLLKQQIPDVSDTLLQLARVIIDHEQVKQEDIDNAQMLVDQIQQPVNTQDTDREAQS